MIAPGTDLTITGNRLGAMADPNGYRFEPEVVLRGSRATYVGPHPNEKMAAGGWHVVLVAPEGRPLFAPVRKGQFVTGWHG